MPGIREVNAHFRQTAVRDVIAQHFHGIVTVDADIAKAGLGHRVERAPDARRMHFNANEIAFRFMESPE